MICEAVKKKGSEERCPNKCLKNVKFCGKHIRMKSQIVWKPKEILTTSAIKIQKVWRSYMIRNYFKLAGPGAIKRCICINDEELVTLESKEDQDPFDFFSFEECGKVWWFSLTTSIKMFSQTANPTNPYTKSPIMLNDRKRFRELWDIYTYRFKQTPRQSIVEKANTIVQIMEENLFPDLNPITFTHVSRMRLLTITSKLYDNLLIWNSEKHNETKDTYCKILNSCLRTQYRIDADTNYILFQCLSALTFIFRRMKNKYPFCFMLASALYVL